MLSLGLLVVGELVGRMLLSLSMTLPGLGVGETVGKILPLTAAVQTAARAARVARILHVGNMSVSQVPR